MKRCALLTCDNLENKILDDDRLEKALSANGWDVQWIVWTETGVDWNSFECAIVRTTWDYTQKTPFFLSQLKSIHESSCRLFNDFEIIQWNIEKTYLQTFEKAGVPVIPTVWKKLESVGQILDESLVLASDSLIIKPQIGAGAKDAFFVKKNDRKGLKVAIGVLKGQDVMIQPFMKRIATEGEYSAHFFNNQLSHMILKTPKSNDFRSQEEFGSLVRKVDASTQQMNFCQSVLNKIPGRTLFARVDFINNEKGEPHLNELELIEPSLYFRYDEEAAPRMVAALESLLVSANPMRIQ